MMFSMATARLVESFSFDVGRCGTSFLARQAAVGFHPYKREFSNSSAGSFLPHLSISAGERRLVADKCLGRSYSSDLYAFKGNLVSVDECLAAHGATEELSGGGRTIFVDGSWHLSKERYGREEYEEGPRIEGARFFDIDDVSSKGRELNPKGLPHMMPPKVRPVWIRSVW